MKKIFPLIAILITLSLIGTIFIQVSWIKNLALVKEDIIKQKIYDAAKKVANELSSQASVKNSLASGPQKNNFLKDPYIKDFQKFSYSARDINLEDVRKKINQILEDANVKGVNIELGYASFDDNSFKNATKNFLALYQSEDKINNYHCNFIIDALSGTADENLIGKNALFVVVPQIKSLVYKSLIWRIVSAILFTLVILAAFYLTFITMLRQKKLAKIKNDFINNMTHEFKTPIATISLAVDAMRNDKVISNKEKLGYFSGIIKEENQRMNRQVETILKASQLERQEVELALKPFHVHELIKDVADNFRLQLEDKKGRIDLSLHASNDLMDVDEVHFSNLINNLLDNAIKYCKENVPPVVKVFTQSNAKKLILKVEDNGIGMNRETVKKIFERFYRAHTGNLHNVKGFGLGLSYVKTMVEAHAGEIKVESTLGKGSIFTVEFPLTKS